MPTTVLLADDHEIFLEGLLLLLGRNPNLLIVGRCTSGAEALSLTHQKKPDLVVLDVFMPGLGPETMIALKQEHPSVKGIALSASQDLAVAQQMLDAGASGYVSKEHAFSELETAISVVLAGGVYLSPSLVSRPSSWDFTSLSPREWEILRLLCLDQTPKEIGFRLGISRKTVDIHKRNLFQKLGTSGMGPALRAEVLGQSFGSIL